MAHAKWPGVSLRYWLLHGQHNRAHAIFCGNRMYLVTRRMATRFIATSQKRHSGLTTAGEIRQAVPLRNSE